MIYRATALLVSVTLVAAACSNANGAYEDVVIADSPVAFWQMDEPDDVTWSEEKTRRKRKTLLKG